MNKHFKGKQYDYRIIIEALGLYYHFSLSYLYRAIDSNGGTLDMWLQNRRDTASTKAFMKRLVRDYGQPRSIATDKYAPSLKAVKELKE